MAAINLSLNRFLLGAFKCAKRPRILALKSVETEIRNRKWNSAEAVYEKNMNF